MTEVENARELPAKWAGGVLPDGLLELLRRVLFYGITSRASGTWRA